jgi:acetyl-CoA C-acetyltransferase
MKKSDKVDIVITSASRTAVGTLGRSLKNIAAEDLGAAVISSVINKSKIKKDEIDEIIFGQVLTGGSGQNTARQAAMKSGIPKEKPAFVVNQVCGSGIRSVASGFQSIKSGDSKIIIAGGQENMSLAPHVIHLREGKKLGDAELIDTMIKDGLWDAFNGYHMGVTAENVAEKFQITREEQDKFALKSQEKSLEAQKKNKFEDEIINFKIKSKKAEIDFNKDEHPREGINFDALSRLKPVFKKDGTVTAGNASGIN